MLKGFYTAVDGDFESALSRLATEERILKYLKNLDKYTNIDVYKQAVEDRNSAEIFENSHSLKGVALNLSLTKLAKYSGELCEATRGGEIPDDLNVLAQRVFDEYAFVIEEISKL